MQNIEEEIQETANQETANKEILKFISAFNEGKQEIIDFFMNGKCFWFAHILKEHFQSGVIVYNQIEGHFSYYDREAKNFYDIRGKMFEDSRDITLYMRNVLIWERLKENDSALYERLLRDCVGFTE